MLKPGSSHVVDGDGPVCEGAPSIVAQTGLTSHQYEKIETAAIDDVQACFATACTAFNRALARPGKHALKADYTGGTKTMTAALVRAATGLYTGRCELRIVTGEPNDLRAVRDGTEAAIEQSSSAIVLEDRWHEALRLTNGYRYGAAVRVLNDLGDPATTVDTPLRLRAMALSTLCQALDAWDRFAFVQA